MVFSSLTFLQCFLPLCLLAYFLVPQKWRNGTLFLFSLLFYAWGEPVYVVLMLFSTALDYTCGQMVERHRGQRGAKIALLVSVCVNLGLLGVFKYSDFLIGTVNSLFGTALPQPNLPLPIGISFYSLANFKRRNVLFSIFPSVVYFVKDVLCDCVPVRRQLCSMSFLIWKIRSA